MGPRRMLAGLGAAVVTMLACCAAVLLVARVGPEWGSGPSLANELLDSGAGGEPLERAERARGSQLADLFDSPLVLAKQKIDGVLREDSSGLAAGEAAAGLQDAQNLAEATTGGEHGAPCTSLKCDNGVYVNNYVSEGQRRVKDALSPPVAGAGDLSAVDQQRYLDAEDAFAGIGALDADTMEAPGKPANMAAITAALKSKLSALKQRFREIRAAFENGPAKTLSINVKPRGPRGPPGVPGDIGPQGNKGPVGSLGPPGRKGPRGPMGRPGKLGRKGKTGPAGSIGKPGTIGGKGAQGATGPRGFPGPPGSRGLPGAAGAPGTNGKDGPPGPPGRNSPEGPPGKPGRKGIRGPAGQSGANGKNGPMGWKGQSGTTGEPGFHGPTGAAGLQGAGPPRAKATLKGLDAAWPKMDCWTMSETCAKLGVYNNLCGKCEPLCKRCGAKSGFKLSNSKGLRYKGLSWDDNSMYAGSVTVRNICLLARYGNGGKFAGKAESIISAKSYGQSAGAESEPHWYGNCKHGDTAQKKCCTNAFLAVSGVKSWDLFSTGNQCGGDLDKDSVTSSVTCIFSEKSLETESKPPKPRDGDSKGGFLVSGGEVDESTYRSKNGKCEFVLDGDGALLVQKDDKTIWQKDLKGVQDSPLKMVMGKDGNLAVYDGSGRSVTTVKVVMHYM